VCLCFWVAGLHAVVGSVEAGTVATGQGLAAAAAAPAPACLERSTSSTATHPPTHPLAPRFPVISSRDDHALVSKCLVLGAADFLCRPLRHNELRNLWTRVWWWRRVSCFATWPLAVVLSSKQQQQQQQQHCEQSAAASSAAAGPAPGERQAPFGSTHLPPSLTASETPSTTHTPHNARNQTAAQLLQPGGPPPEEPYAFQGVSLPSSSGSEETKWCALARGSGGTGSGLKRHSPVFCL